MVLVRGLRALASLTLHAVGLLLAPPGRVAHAGGLLARRGGGARAPGLEVLTALAVGRPKATRRVLAWLSHDLAWLGPRRHRWPWSSLWVRSACAAERLLMDAPPSPQAEAAARELARWDPDLMSPALSPERAPGLLRHFEHDWGRNPFRRPRGWAGNQRRERERPG